MIAALFFLEKNWRHGVMLSRIAGAACVLLGLVVIVQPELLGLA